MGLNFIKKKGSPGRTPPTTPTRAQDSADSFELPDFKKKKENGRRKGGGWWWFGRSAQGVLQSAETSTAAEAAAASHGALSLGAESAASVAQNAVRAAGAVGKSLASSAWGFVPSAAIMGKIALGGVLLAFVGGTVAALMSSPRQIGAFLRMAAPGSMRPLPTAAPNSLAYASRGLPVGASNASGRADAGAVARSAGAQPPNLAAGIAGLSVRQGGAPVPKGLPLEKNGAPGMSAPPAGMLPPPPNANPLQSFAGQGKPGSTHDPILAAQAQAVAPGSLQATSALGGQGGGMLALGQLRSASSINSHVMQGESETGAMLGQQVFDNPAGAAGQTGGAQITGAGDGYGANSVINGSGGSSASGSGGAPIAAGGGLGQCAGSLDACRGGEGSTNNATQAAPAQSALNTAFTIAGIAGLGIAAVAALVTAGGPVGMALAIAGAGLVSMAGIYIMTSGYQMLQAGANSGVVAGVETMGASLIAGAVLAMAGGVAGLVGAGIGIANAVAAIVHAFTAGG